LLLLLLGGGSLILFAGPLFYFEHWQHAAVLLCLF
jgi:hypothetical protein